MSILSVRGEQSTSSEISFLTNITGLSYAQGDILYYNGTNLTRLAVGSNGQFLKTQGASANPIWATIAGGGDVTKVGTPVNNQVGVWTGDGTIEGDASLTFDTTTDVLSSGGLLLSSLTASEIVITDASKNLVSAAVATYPSLTELTYVKGVTSALQTQLGLKAPLASPTFTGTVTISTPFTIGAVSMTATGTELNHVVGVTSAIQTQLDGKSPTAGNASLITVGTVTTGTWSATSIALNKITALTASEIVGSDASGFLASLAVATYPSLTELTYVKGVTSAIQTQLGNKAASGANSDITSLSGITGAVGVGSVNGIDYNPGSDVDIDIITVGVTGTPRLYWDEAGDILKTTKGFYVTGSLTGTSQIITPLIRPSADNGQFQINTRSYTASSGIQIPVQIAPVINGSGTQGYNALEIDVTETATGSGVKNLLALQVANTDKFTIDNNGNVTTVNTIELGHATNTTISRVSAGVVAVEGNNIITANIASSLTVAGVVELATTAEIDTGTDTTRAIPIDQFVASTRNVRYVLYRILAPATATTVSTTVGGDLEFPFTGTITEVGAYVDTAGTTNLTTVDINKAGTTILSTKITIDSTEKSSRTAATAPVISVSAITVGDLLTFDIDAIQTTAALGLTVRIGVRMS